LTSSSVFGHLQAQRRGATIGRRRSRNSRISRPQYRACTYYCNSFYQMPIATAGPERPLPPRVCCSRLWNCSMMTDTCTKPRLVHKIQRPDCRRASKSAGDDDDAIILENSTELDHILRQDLLLYPLLPSLPPGSLQIRCHYIMGG